MTMNGVHVGCSWTHKESGTPCGKEATVYSNIPLCVEHIESLRGYFGTRSRTAALQAAKHHSLSEFPGLCYIVLLPDGNVKIGYSNTDDLLAERFKALGREYEAPVVKLAVIPGGFVAEAVLHDRFKEYRLPGLGERFSYSAELAEFIHEQ